MGDQNNTEIVKAIYAAFQRGDIDAILNALTDDVEWYLPGVAPFAGHRHGRDQIRQFFEQLGKAVRIDNFDVREFIAERDKVVVLGNERATALETGQHFEMDWAHVYTLRGGKVAAIHLHEDTHASASVFGESSREKQALGGSLGVTHPAYSGRPNRDF